MPISHSRQRQHQTNKHTTTTTDVATLIRKGLEVSESVLPSVAFTPNGISIAWMTTGPTAQELTYTVRPF